jgi:lysophospholipid acyltransferase
MFGAACYTYAITSFMPAARWTPVVCFVLLMLHMSYVHLGVQIWHANDPTRVDASSTMMVLVMKLSSFAWSVYDGTRPDEKLSEEQRLYAVKKQRIYF